MPPQSCPSASLQLADWVGGEAAQVPSPCPASPVEQMPVQQSASARQTSPGCAQKDDAWQVPFAHLPEQHSALDAHELPMVLHDVLSDAQLPPTQF